MNLAHIIGGHAPDHVAIVSRGIETTYGQLRDQVAKVRGGLAKLGVAKGDRIALLCGNGLYFVETYLAALGLGAVVVPLNPQSPSPEIENQIATVGASVVLVEPAAAAAWNGVDLEAVPSVRHVIPTEPGGLDADFSFGDLIADEPLDVIEVEPDTLAVLMFTSGTAGSPRAAMLSHGNLASNALALNELWGFSPGDVLLHALPIFHIHGLFVALHTAFFSASKIVFLPKFDPAEIRRRLKAATVMMGVPTFYTRLLDDPAFIADAVFERLVFGFHPYGLPNSGTPQTLAAITREDLQAYHRRNFVPNNMILAIVGDITGEEGFAAAERVFGAWPRGDVQPVTVTEPPPSTRRIVIVDKPDAVQTEIRVGQIAIPRKHADYLAFDLAVKILGGEGANRLHRVLRSERGLTYGASASAESRKQSGDFVAETDTRTETTGEALRLMVDEISKLQRERVFERELSDAQAYLAGSFPLTIETPNDIATQVLNVVFYELPVEEIGTFRERVQRVTPDDIQRVARAYVRPDRLSIVLVGNASEFVPQLRRVGFSDFEIVPIEALDIMSATLRRGR